MKIEVHNKPYVGIFIDGVQLDKELYTARNANPEYKDFTLCVQHRGMNPNVLKHWEEIIKTIKDRKNNGETTFSFHI